MTTSVENLATVWRSIGELCSDLSEDEWKHPTGCPGWTVQDNLSHIVDYESRAVGRPAPQHAPADLSHTRNPMGEANEVGVDFRRGRSGAEVLAEFREVTAERLTQLRALDEHDLRREVQTPAGPGTMAEMLTLRVMDCWTHEQDIRRALGRPGHAEGPVADEAVGYWTRFLPFVVGKKAAAPDGATVLFRIGDRPPVAMEVVDGRARVAAAPPAAPTVALSLPATTFAALVGARSDAPGDVDISGDRALGERVVAGLGFMP